jgi:hypothetical protein
VGQLQKKNLILSLCSGPELQLLLPPALVGFRALHEGAKGGRGDSVHGPGRVRQSQHFHQPMAGGPHQTRHDTVQWRLPADIYLNFPPKCHLFPVDFLIGPSGQIR